MELVIFWASVFIFQAVFILVLFILLCCCYRFHRNGQKQKNKSSHPVEVKQSSPFLDQSQDRRYVHQNSTRRQTTREEPTNEEDTEYVIMQSQSPSLAPNILNLRNNGGLHDEPRQNDFASGTLSPRQEISSLQKTISWPKRDALRLPIREPGDACVADTPLTTTSPSQAPYNASSPIPQMDGVIIHKNIAYGDRERQTEESHSEYMYITAK